MAEWYRKNCSLGALGLYILNISRAATGTYRCTAYNGIGNPVNHSLHINVTCKYGNVPFRWYLYFFLIARAEGIQETLQSDWFRKLAEFYYSAGLHLASYADDHAINVEITLESKTADALCNHS